MARRPSKKKHHRGKSDDKKRRTSLFRRLSSKRAEQHLGSPMTPSRSFTSLSRSLSSGDSLPGSPTRSPKSPPLSRMWSPASDSARSTGDTSSNSSSPNSSTPNSPASSAHFSRPSSLHGLKHKLQTIKSPHRRKSVHNIPLSPLARTPSPSPMATSPTRSPSPLTMGQVPHHHSAVHGISNMTQTYNPSTQSSPSPVQLTPAARKIGRPKSCEPGSPLLRRALSPDRLHPSSAEKQAQANLIRHRKQSWHERRSDEYQREKDRQKERERRHSYGYQERRSDLVDRRDILRHSYQDKLDTVGRRKPSFGHSVSVPGSVRYKDSPPYSSLAASPPLDRDSARTRLNLDDSNLSDSFSSHGSSPNRSVLTEAKSLDSSKDCLRKHTIGNKDKTELSSTKASSVSGGENSSATEVGTPKRQSSVERSSSKEWGGARPKRQSSVEKASKDAPRRQSSVEKVAKGELKRQSSVDSVKGCKRQSSVESDKGKDENKTSSPSKTSSPKRSQSKSGSPSRQKKTSSPKRSGKGSTSSPSKSSK